MSEKAHIAYMLMIAACVVGVVLISGWSFQGGYDKRVAEEEASREYVFDKMKELNFCRWLAITRFDEDCRAERIRATPKEGT